MHITRKHILRTLGTILVVPPLLVVLAIALAYCPPVQKWLINEVGEHMEEALGMRVHVDDVRITPFLDLIAEGVTATDTEGDTLLASQRLTFDVAFRPLFEGRADIDGFVLQDTRLNTKSLIADCRIEGHVPHLSADAHSIAWTPQHIHLNRALLKGADLSVCLTDTAAEDTTTTHLRWVIDVDKASISHSRIALTLPPDSTATTLFTDANIVSANMEGGHFDLGTPHYAFRRFTLLDSKATVGTSSTAPTLLTRRDTLVDFARLGAIVDTLSYDRDGVLRCNVRNLTFDENQYHLNVREIGGSIYLDSTRIEVPALNFHTAASRVNGSVAMDWEALRSGDFGSMRVNIDAALGREDIKAWLGTAVLKHYLDPSLLKNDYLRPFLNSDIHLRTTLSGNLSSLNIEHYDINLPRLLSAKGRLRIADDFNSYDGTLRANLYGGLIDGSFATHLAHETYSVNANVRHLPLKRFLPNLAVGPFSGHLQAKGKGFDPTKVRSALQAGFDVQQLSYSGYDLSGLCGDATFSGGLATANLHFANALGRAAANIEADLRHGYDAVAHIVLDELDLQQLCGTEAQLTLHTAIDLQASASADLKRITAQGHIGENFLTTPTRSAEMKDIDLDFATSPLETYANIAAGDLDLHAAFEGDIDHITRATNRLTDVLLKQIEGKSIDQAALRSVMPTGSLSLHAGKDNPVHNFLLFQGTDVASIDLDLTTNPTDGINGHANTGTIRIGALQLDTVYADIVHDDEGIRLQTTAHNYLRENPNRFTATVEGRLLSTGFDAALNFKDAKGKTGIDIGLRSETHDGTARFTLYPQNPIIAYRTFTINDDNFVSINRQGMVRADVHLVADDGTGLLIYSEPTDEATNDITLSLYNLNLGELCDVLPYMPRMSGMVNGDFHVIENKNENDDKNGNDDDDKNENEDENKNENENENRISGISLSAMGTINAENFAYDGTPIGNIGAEIIYLPKENGEHYADAFISFNEAEVGEASGVYYDTDGHFNGHVVLNDFPLTIANAFLEGTGIMMRGKALGELEVSGTTERTTMNGTLNFADAHIYSPVYGVDFRMEERPLQFNDSRLEFERYRLTSGNTDLFVNGNLNMKDLSDIRLDFGMKAKSFALINAPRQASSLVYGKVFADFDGTAKGRIDDLLIRGQLDILPSTDATYLLTNSPLTVDDRLADLVTFMDFSDTTHVETLEPESEMRYDLTLGINVDNGAKFHCFLSNNGSSYVDVQGGGFLTMRMSQGSDLRLIGRYTIQEGEMNYELPVIPLKKFQLAQGSYVEFSGDIMNPRLAITATEETKAIVSDNDTQRNVNFIVGVDVSRTLQDMGLAFTIEAPEDLSVQNQLASMSAEDRYKTAVALLATGMYVTENLTTGLKASSALNAFLQNEIQNIAGKALSTFDLSFGMENGTSAAGTTTTDYSFRFSKRFLDDRISINIGGSLSTGQDATNDAASFIDNISLEYRLDNSGTRYVRVFYDRDTHDPLEGSMMTTGAGLVLRRQTDRLGELFLFRKPKAVKRLNE